MINPELVKIGGIVLLVLVVFFVLMGPRILYQMHDWRRTRKLRRQRLYGLRRDP